MEIGDVFISVNTRKSVEIVNFTESQVTYRTNEERSEFQSSLERFEREHDSTD